MQDSASFWTEIKRFEEQLSRAPDSYCFAALSSVYLKAGLIDDALHVARQGVAKHPGYLSGQRALSLACHAKGLNDEALVALRGITLALPEDIISQKLMGRLLVEAGEQEAAAQTFRTALEFAPDDVECRLQLESLVRPSPAAEGTVLSDDVDEEVLEDLEILEELDVLEEDDPEFEPPASIAPHDPLSTGTLAELYVQQGFIHKALEIYRALLVDSPMDQTLAERVAELESLLVEPVDSDAESECDDTDEEKLDDAGVVTPVSEEFFLSPEPLPVPESDALPVFESRLASADGPAFENAAPVVPVQGAADDALAVLDGWLENIGRIKSCR